MKPQNKLDIRPRKYNLVKNYSMNVEIILLMKIITRHIAKFRDHQSSHNKIQIKEKKIV